MEIKISKDENAWCAMKGLNPIEGFVGFGDTHIKALKELCDDEEFINYLNGEGFAYEIAEES